MSIGIFILCVVIATVIYIAMVTVVGYYRFKQLIETPNGEDEVIELIRRKAVSYGIDGEEFNKLQAKAKADAEKK